MARLAALAARAIHQPFTKAIYDQLKANLDYELVLGADVASATTLGISARIHKVTGTVTIDSISDALGAIAGQRVRLIFQAQTTVRHNGGGTGNIRLVGGIHAGFVANETLELTFDGTNWIEAHRSPVHLSGQGGIIHNAALGSLTGYLVEDGSAISRTSFAAWFANVGTQYGVGDGSTTVNLPDSRGRVDVGHAPSGGHTDVSTIGNSDGVALSFRRAKHRHTAHTHSMTPNNDFNTPSNINDGGNTTGGSTPSAYSVGVSTVDGGSGNANDALDAPAWLVRPKLTRI